MENFPQFTEPVALARPPGAHRLEAFSPKLGRRLTFYRRALLDLWLLFEADASVIAFCERPGYVHLGGNARLADFWVQYVDRQELVLLADAGMDERAAPGKQELDEAAFSIRSMSSGDLAAARVWIGNWQRMLPCIVANRGLIPWSLSRSVERLLENPQQLETLERKCSNVDPVLFRAALFGLVHGGRVAAPDLRTQPLSLHTSFAVVDTNS
ncbi:hypothetical protein [Cupriavidus necator]|uniref:hypothetical protein n=1 Tax=Cupriavidus necator TaxID=106590 RepID=UPI00339D3B1A